jgi:integrase
MSQKIFKSLDLLIEDNPDFEDVLEKIHELAEGNEPTLKTVASRYSKIKKYIREKYPKYSDTELKQIRPDEEITKTIIQDDLEKRSQKTNITFDDNLINKILSYKNSSNDLEKSIYLQFISGRRINEIKSSDSIIKTFKDKVKMKLSKTKDNSFQEIFLLPNTLTSKEFKKQVDNLRSRIADISVADWTSRVNRYMKKNLNKDLTSHNLRGIYGTYAYHKHNDNNLNINGFLTEVLNHSSYDSSMNYSKYKYNN